MGAKPEHVCAHCRQAWPKEGDGPARCPECGHPASEPPRFRFTLKGVLVLAVLCLLVVGAAASAKKKRGGAETSTEQTESTGESRTPSTERSRVGIVPCGYCNGDGRIDEADLNRRDPPYIRGASGSRCPACAGRGGVGK